MTLPAYPGRHATFDATTVLPAVPPSGAPPGRPAAVDAAFWVAVAQAVVAVAGCGLVAVTVLAFALGYGETAGIVAAAAILGVAVAANVGWLVLGWRARNGSPGARVGFAVLTGLGLLASLGVCVLAWSTVLPMLGLALQTAVLVLLLRPSSNAWYRAVSPAPGPGSPPR